jgi:hypothetical protein
MVEMSELEEKYEYTVEFDDGSEFVHLYFTDVVDIENTSFIRFDPLFEMGKDIERKVSGETVMIPYSRVLRVIKRKPED